MADFDFELDQATFNDFLGEFDDAYEDLEQTLVALDQAPDNRDLINQLFRTVHSIKSNLRMVGLDRLSDVVHILENILDDIRNGRLQYVQGFNDVTLVTISRIRDLAQSLFRDEDVAQALNQLNVAIQTLCMVEPEQLGLMIVPVLKKIDPDHERVIKAEQLSTDAVDHADMLSQLSQQYPDLDFFVELVQQYENSHPHWQGRSQRNLELCLKMNRAAGMPIDSAQLVAAVLLHDIGMSFLPDAVINKPEKLTADEELILQHHCYLGHEWVRRIPGWEAAAQMIYQHHERLDGKGYPQGLSGEAICAGAKVLAIADTFEAMTQSRSHREHQRPKMRAVLEINSQSGSQFDVAWVEAFNQIMKKG